MTRALPSSLAALAGVLLFPSLALAGPKGDAVGTVLFGPLILALLALPGGWAVQALILARAPRRGHALLQAARRYRWKTIFLGLANTGFLAFLVAATAKPAPALALLGAALWLLLAAVGAHGLARSLGAQMLGREQPSGPPADLAEVSLGWLALLLSTSIPLVGLFLALYWGVRATGCAILALLAVELEPPPELPDPYSPSA